LFFFFSLSLALHNVIEKLRFYFQFLLTLILAAENQPELIALEVVVGRVLVLALIRWWKERIDCNSEGILYHRGNQPSEEGGTKLEAGIGIDLYEPSVEVLIDHEVQSEDLEGELSPVLVEDGIGGPHEVSGKLLNFLILTTMRG
jgi:hypothetical protein